MFWQTYVIRFNIICKKLTFTFGNTLLHRHAIKYQHTILHNFSRPCTKYLPEATSARCSVFISFMRTVSQSGTNKWTASLHYRSWILLASCGTTHTHRPRDGHVEIGLIDTGDRWSFVAFRWLVQNLVYWQLSRRVAINRRQLCHQFSSVQFVTLLKQNVLRGCRLAWTGGF